MITVEPTLDTAFIKGFVLSPFIWKRISCELNDKCEYNPDMNDLWLKVKVNNAVVGLCEFVMRGNITFELHPYFTEKTKRHGRYGVIECLKWLKSQTYRRVDKIIKGCRFVASLTQKIICFANLQKQYTLLLCP